MNPFIFTRSCSCLIGTITAILLTVFDSSAQEHLLNYHFHPQTTVTVAVQSANTAQKLLSLPFFEDFSQNHTYPVEQQMPNSARWVDKNAWINMTLPLNPPSFGVATLDGLTAGGQPYSYVPNAVGPADTLTSAIIDLHIFSPADSVYLSFFYEPMGLGDYPDVGDSLILEFLDVNGNWVFQWGMDGYAATPANASQFTEVLLGLYNSDFYHSAFQFRFRNIATYGNNDHWHLDYLKLDQNRNYLDGVVSDEAFVYPPSRVLKHYNQMPWNQFQANPSNEWNTSITTPIYNNWAVPRNTAYGMVAYDAISGTPIKSFIGPSIAVNANAYAVPTPVDSTNYTVPTTAGVDNNCRHIIANKCYFNSGAPEYTNNDTLVYKQEFRNVFAYDDGTAEWAYGLEGNSSTLAVQFSLNQPDTLRAIKFHWAHIVTDNSNKLFNLKVWQSIDLSGGTNDVVLYTKNFLKPVYIDAYYDSINGFTTYKLDTALVLPAGTFYVGWEQLQADVLNVGFDANSDFHQNLFYNTGLGWTNSTQIGSVMIRPQFGSACLEETSTAITAANGTSKSDVYPNPASHQLFIKTNKASALLNLEVIDALGRIQSCNYSQIGIGSYEINLQHLSAGLYYVRYTTADYQTQAKSFYKN